MLAFVSREDNPALRAAYFQLVGAFIVGLGLFGATGVSMHALAAMQLTGSAGDLQVNNARLGGIFNMGGTAVANYVSILERIK